MRCQIPIVSFVLLFALCGANPPPARANPPPARANPPPASANPPPGRANPPPARANPPPARANPPPASSSRINKVETEQGIAMSVYDCGGSIIAPKWILTAAHCTYYENLTMFHPDVVSVYVGSNTARTGTQYTAKKLIPHPKYEGAPYDFDLALIELDEEIPADVGSPVELAEKTFDSDNQHAVVIGWGTTESGYASTELREAKVTLIPKESCAAVTYSRDYGGDESGVRKTQLCAAIETHTSQQFGKGDSGGPLLFGNQDDPESLIQIGIVSNDDEILYHPVSKIFNLYTEVAQFRDWIQETMDENE